MRRRKDAEAKPPGAYERALGLLARREHSGRELQRKLASRGHDAAESKRALGALREERLQSDERFAGSLIRQRAAAGYGPRHVEAELRSHGIDPRAHGEALRDPDWRAIARRMLAKRYGAGPIAREQRTKAAQYLARRGFPADIVYAATGARIADEE